MTKQYSLCVFNHVLFSLPFKYQCQKFLIRSLTTPFRSCFVYTTMSSKLFSRVMIMYLGDPFCFFCYGSFNKSDARTFYAFLLKLPHSASSPVIDLKPFPESPSHPTKTREKQIEKDSNWWRSDVQKVSITHHTL